MGFIVSPQLHGGYDFPGSNSGIDMMVLTGWIPESIKLNSAAVSETASVFGGPVPASSDGWTDHDWWRLREKTWMRFLSATKYGDCLITIATGQVKELCICTVIFF